MSRAHWPLLLVAAFAVFAPRAAHAADAEEEAAAAYDRGASAYDRQDFVTAANELARADELAPNDVTLELALNAALRGTDALFAMTLVERAEKRPHPSARLVTATEAVRKRFASSVGTITVVCSGEPACVATIDEKAVPSNVAIAVAAGKHRVEIARGDAREKPREVVVGGAKSVELLADTPESVRMDAHLFDREPSRGIAPVWFWVGSGVTVALGGATVLSAIDTASTHDDFASDRSNVDLSNDGKSAERRTFVLGAVTGVLAIATAVVGVALVDWNRGKVAIGPDSVRVRF
jgi:hypothetical protein